MIITLRHDYASLTRGLVPNFTGKKKKSLEKVYLLFRVRKLAGKFRTLAAGDGYRMSGGTARLSSLRDLLSLPFGSLHRSALIADNRGHRR